MNRLSRANIKSTFTALLIATTLFLQFLCFKHYVAHCIAPAYPGNFDQLQYIDFAYKTFFITKTGGSWSQALAMFQALNPMRGSVSPLMGALFVQIFGLHRLSVLSVNFFAFAIAELSILFAFGRRKIFSCGLFACGLFQLCFYTHYFGSMADFRLDYVAMMFMGLSYLCGTKWLQTGNKKVLIAFTVAAILTTCTRSVTIFYLIAGTGMSTATFILASLVRKEILLQAKRAVGMLLALIVVFTCYFAVFWQAFLQYYVRCKSDGECAMAQQMFGVTDFKSTAMFYAGAFAAHYLYPMIACSAALLTGFLISKLRKTNNSAVTLDIETFTAITLCLTLLVSVISFAAFFAPNAIVVGVTAIPVCHALAVLFNRQFTCGHLLRLQLNVAVSIFIAGISFYVLQMCQPIACPAVGLHQATILLRDCESLLLQSNGVQSVYWCWPHDGLNPQAFEILAYEHGNRALLTRLTHAQTPAFPAIDSTQFKTALEACTYLIAPVGSPPVFRLTDLDGHKAVRNNFALIQKYIATNFSLITQSSVPTLGESPVSLEMGLYKRVRK